MDAWIFVHDPLERWKADKEELGASYWPPDTPRVDSFSGGRKPTQTN